MVGVTDDVRPLEAIPRLFLQAVAVAVVLATFPVELRVLPIGPWWFERTLLIRRHNLVCEPRQFYGRNRLDDGGGSRPADRRVSLFSD